MALRPGYHQQARGIHPGAFVQSSAPNTSDVQDGVLWVDTSTPEPWQLRCWDAAAGVWRRVGATATGTSGAAQDIYVQAAPPAAPPDQALWIDTSSGPPYVQRVWRAATSTWDVLQMDATGYPLPDGARLDAQPPSGPATNGSIHLWDSRDGPLTWIDATTYGLAAGSPITIGTQINLRASPLTLAAIALDVPTPIPAGASFTFAVYAVPFANLAPVQLAKVNAGPEIAQQAVGHNGWPGIVLPSPLTLDDTYLSYVIAIEIVGSQWGRAGNYYGYNDYIDSSAYFVQHAPQPNLNDAGFDAATLISTSDSATGIDIDASYTAPADLLRLVHPDGTVDITHDLTTCRIKSKGTDALITPLPTLSSVPPTLVGQDPQGLTPAYFPNPLGDYAKLTDVADRPHMAYTAQLGPVAQWGTPPDPPIGLPDPVVDNCPIMRCGAAYYLSQKLKEQYDIVRGLLLWMLAAPLILGGGGTAFEVLLGKLVDWLVQKEVAGWIVAVVRYLLRRVRALGLTIAAGDLEDLGAGGASTLQRLAYGSLTCSNNTFDLTPDMLVAWQQAIMADTVDFTEWQRNLLVYCVQLTPFATYHQLAATGAEKTSDTCGGWGP